MVYKEENHLMGLLNDLKEISQKVSFSSIKTQELESVFKSLKKLLKQPLSEQATELIKNQIGESEAKQEKLEESILCEFDAIFQKYKLTNDPEVMLSLKFLNSPSGLNVSDVDWQCEILRNMIIGYKKKPINCVNHNFRCLTNDDELNIVLNTPNLVAWRMERFYWQEKLAILQYIEDIKKFKNKLNPDRGPDSSKFIIKVICNHLISLLFVTDKLAKIKVKTIGYKYHRNKEVRNAKLKLFINEKSISFTGKRAKMLKKVLKEPRGLKVEKLDLENKNKKDTKKKIYNRVWEHYREADQRISLKFPEFDLESIFVGEEGHTVKVNHLYQRLIYERY